MMVLPPAPRIARRLLKLVTPIEHRGAVIGELDREYEQTRGERGRLKARGWYWRQVLTSIPPLWRLGHAQPLRPARDRSRHFASDVRHALRRWAARPATTLTAVATLAIGLAAVTSIFSVINAVVLRPLPWIESDRLVAVWVVRPLWREMPGLSASWDRGDVSWPIWTDLQGVRALADIGVWSSGQAFLAGESNEMVPFNTVSSSFLPMLGVQPAVGRFFASADDISDAGTTLISYDNWRRRFGSDPSVLERDVTLNGVARRVIGVLPPHFSFSGTPPEFVLPIGAIPLAGRTSGNHQLKAVGRLAAGVSLSSALPDIEPRVRGGDDPSRKTARLVSLADDQLGPSRKPLYALFAGAVMVLLLAGTNMTGLLLSDGLSRRNEMTVRVALGASRARLVRQLLSESALLALVAWAVGLLVAVWFTPVLISLAPAELPRLGQVEVNAQVLIFALLAALVIAVFSAVGPALAVTSTRSGITLREAPRGGASRRHAGQMIVVSVQVALALALVVGTALLAETVRQLRSTPTGFDTANLLVATVRTLRDADEPIDLGPRRTALLLDRLAAIPGVTGVAGTGSAPFSGLSGANGISIPGRTVDVSANRQIVTDHYFAVMRIATLAGRVFDSRDLADRPTAVVSREFARRYFDGTALGRTFVLNGKTLEIVGVVEDAASRRFGEIPQPVFYGLDRQLPSWRMNNFVLRSDHNAPPLSAEIIAALRDFGQRERWLVPVRVERMDVMMTSSIAAERFRATLAVSFGVCALTLAVVGIYGLMSRSVADRQREIGVRLALGATPADIYRLIIGHSVRLVAFGVLVGLMLALLVARYLASMLFGVSPTAIPVFGVATIIVVGAAILATAVPASRACRLNPVVVMKAE